jgi:uncharacterized protein (DUF1800 family)
MQGFARSSRVLTGTLVALAIWAGHPAAITQRPKSPVPDPPDDRVIAHVLNRIGFGPAPGDVERVRNLGIAAYIDQQLHPERLQDQRLAEMLAPFETLTMSTRDIAERYYLPALAARRERQRAAEQATPGQPDMAQATPPRTDAMREQRVVMLELSQQKVLRAAYSERQLEEVMVDFWFNHFNVFAGKGPTRLYVTEYERDAIRPHALGKFRDLLGATAQSPAMLFYLDNWQSSAPLDAAAAGAIRRPQVSRGRGRATGARLRNPPEMTEAAQNRRPRGINENYARELMELHTLGVDGGYTQKDVQEVARAFTGWTIANPRLGGGFRFEPRMHDRHEKVVLGRKIKAGGGQDEGERVLDMLAEHPSTARHIATKLARRFVSDTPPSALVDRAARRFRDTHGDIREVVRTIVLSPEFFAPEAYRAKVKTPLEFVVSAVRATGVETPNGLPLVQAVRELGMPLYMCQPPTGYADKAEAWVNTGALLNRMNFAVALTTGRMRGGRTQRAPVSSTSLSSDTLIKTILAGDISATTAATVAKASTPPQAIALVLGSPEFQKR